MNAKPILRYPGAKWSIAEWIISHFVPHDVYLEPFFGSGAVFFTKQPSRLETINDINGDVINLFKVLRDCPDDLSRKINLTPWARQEYLESVDKQGNIVRSGDCVEDARRYLVRCWQAMSGKLDGRTGWRHDVKCECGQNHVKTWLKVPFRIQAYAERLKDAQIENRPAVDLIKRYSSKNVLINADPPYVRSTRAGSIYRNEMNDDDHIELLEILCKHPGPVILSGYECELYDVTLSNWTKKLRSAVADKGKMSQETLWINPVASRQLGTLF